ncbi:MAG: TonB-dependent receptor plug domain-containing protein, partial [Steroidobacteraceae bacterium]|nr:TonB-dependent receptor plug domain-containing protein [Steroidobacteraceae bacterium]
MRIGRHRPLTIVLVGLVVQGTLSVSPARADEAGGQALDEVIVQARKVQENLQEVPLSISVIGSEDIARQNLSSTEDIAKLDPSVIWDYGASMQDMRVVIRGLSPTRGRVNSAVLIDGVDVTSESIQFAGGSLLAGSRIFDLEQVEIVKGPQAALYGRASFAGAISYRTKDPAKEFGGEVKLDGGDYGQYSAGAGIDIPLGDSFGVRLSGTYWSKDGIYRNTALNAKVGGGDGYGASLTAKWEATENFTARLRVDYNDDEEDQRAARYLRTNVRLDPNPANTCANAAARLASSTCVFTGTGLVGNTPGSFTRLFYWGSVGRLDDYPDRRATYSPDPSTGQMYPGATREVLRANLN